MTGDGKTASPEPAAIRDARTAAGLTQVQAAELVYTSDRNWQYWEAGTHPMPVALWELFLVKLSQLAGGEA